jgi:hypothetical protein
MALWINFGWQFASAILYHLIPAQAAIFKDTSVVVQNNDELVKAQCCWVIIPFVSVGVILLPAICQVETVRPRLLFSGAKSSFIQLNLEVGEITRIEMILSLIMIYAVAFVLSTPGTFCPIK